LVGSIAPILVALALAQYPIYGALVARVQNPARVWIALGCVHVGSVITALLLMNRSGGVGENHKSVVPAA
jgi:hypothetical protein